MATRELDTVTHEFRALNEILDKLEKERNRQKQSETDRNVSAQQQNPQQGMSRRSLIRSLSGWKPSGQYDRDRPECEHKRMLDWALGEMRKQLKQQTEDGRKDNNKIWVLGDRTLDPFLEMENLTSSILRVQEYR